MDIRLKNSRKPAILLIAVTVMTAALVVMDQYCDWYVSARAKEAYRLRSVVESEAFLQNFLSAGVILYNLESGEGKDTEKNRGLLQDYYQGMEDFEELYPFLDYCVKDEEGKDIAKSTADSGPAVTENNLSSFAVGMVVTYDKYGEVDVRIKEGEYKAEQSACLRGLISQFDKTELEVEYELYDEDKNAYETILLEMPRNRTYIYAMTQENLDSYIYNNYDTNLYNAEAIVEFVFFVLLAVTVLAWLLPALPVWHLEKSVIFQAPLELAAAGFLLTMYLLNEKLWWLLEEAEGIADIDDLVLWVSVFAVTFWAALCLRQVYTMGIRRYLKERTLCVRYWRYICRAWQLVRVEAKEWAGRCYRSLERVDLSKRNNQVIFKTVAVNFMFLAFIYALCYNIGVVGGFLPLALYSLVLFQLLRKYFNNIQEKYVRLLKATGEIAEGNLDVEITEDLGIFNPFRQEIQKIQKGFKKAVGEEVKSQRMKTELITNVSHDLKTPLTAILTYVGLLKEEKDEEKRNDYIAVLESKSLRLKVLIEDLFEISKASSKNVTLHIVDVDVANLFKQVKLELEDKISGADLDFRCSYPEEKLVAPLDSQKTYRVFENLLINIIKYAMPHTRVYIEIARDENEAVVRMKNVSAAELNFNPDEITERFVRGDASRNTEGSGLGLAIVKSFVDLQRGKFRIETEADLFKTEVRFLL